MTHDHAQNLVSRLLADAQQHARDRIRDVGMHVAWDAFKEEAGSAEAALHFVTRAQGGVYLGDVLDPRTRDRGGPLVVDPHLGAIAYGPPGTGKTSTVVVPRVATQLALGEPVVLVTPQVKTVAAVFAIGRAYTGGRVRVVDLGGKLIPPGSPHFRAWDPTAGCANPEIALRFGQTFAGPNTPFHKDLGSEGALFWGGPLWTSWPPPGT